MRRCFYLLSVLLVICILGLSVSCAPDSDKDEDRAGTGGAWYDESSPDIEYGPIEVEATERSGVYRLVGNPGRGYYFDCYLYIPVNVRSSQYLLVEANNDGYPSWNTLKEESDYVFSHLDSYWSMKFGKSLNTPVLIPAMQRPDDGTSDMNINTHNLAYEAIHDAVGSLERVDRQLVAAIRDAQEYINTTWGSNLDEKILMYGFSAGGLFTTRFSLLNPEMVYAACAGGTQGMFALPMAELNGNALNYPLGTADYYSLTGHEFSISAWSEIRMFLFSGETDDNDGITPRDCWPADQSKIIISEIGTTMTQRLETVSGLYKAYTENAQIVLYRDAGHIVASLEDIVEFFRKNMVSSEMVKIQSEKDVIEY